MEFLITQVSMAVIPPYIIDSLPKRAIRMAGNDDQSRDYSKRAVQPKSEVQGAKCAVQT